MVRRNALPVAASFNAPIAGVFFAIEVVVGQDNVTAFTPADLNLIDNLSPCQWLLRVPGGDRFDLLIRQIDRNPCHQVREAGATPVPFLPEMQMSCQVP